MKYNVFITDYFSKKIRSYTRKYRRIFADCKDFITVLENNPQTGDKLKGCIGPVFKARLASRDMNKGKSGGFRVIYLVRENDHSVFLLTLYPKNEQANICVNQVNGILKQTGFA
ncbi:MAG: hypothetical protein ACD_66C00268G0004 [uncultured bacterium]|nr:MAG: hypothetical protein ACD_66C00268G0004 [uncultured bacterium]